MDKVAIYFDNQLQVQFVMLNFAQAVVLLSVAAAIVLLQGTVGSSHHFRDHYLEVYPNVTGDSTTSLYFGLMLSLSGDQQSTGALAGIQAALDDINSRDELLPGYSLHYTLTDSQVARIYITAGISASTLKLCQPTKPH